MKTNIMAKGIDLTPDITNYVEKKLSSVDKYLKDHQDVVLRVEVGRTTDHHKSGDIFKAEAHITGGGLDQYAVVEKDDLYAAIDEVKDEITRELKKEKGKSWAIARRSAALGKNVMKGFWWTVEKARRFKFKRRQD